MSRGPGYQITENEISAIDEIQAGIIKHGKLGNDLRILLHEGIESYKLGFFHASISVLTVVLEKYLRDILIWCEFRSKKSSHPNLEHLEYLEIVEAEIEDGKNELNAHYSFNTICDGLVSYGKITKDGAEVLKGFYKEVRIPVQHGIYARLIKNEFGSESYFNVKKIILPENASGSDIIKLLDEATKGSLDERIRVHNPLPRQFVLPNLFKAKSIQALEILAEIALNMLEDTKDNAESSQ